MFDTFARFYDADMGSFDTDLPLYNEFARRVDGPILDAMCGTGRVILDLAHHGHQVAGLDISPAMVRVTQAKAQAQGLTEWVHVVQGDIRSFDMGQQFGLILIPLNSLLHLLTVEDQLAALQSIYQNLQPDGLLIIDVWSPTPDTVMQDQGVLVQEKTFMLNGASVQKYVVHRTDWAAQHQDVQFVYDECAADGLVRRHVLPFAMRWVYRFELEHILYRTGFGMEAVYGDYELSEYTNHSSQMIVVAHRA